MYFFFICFFGQQRQFVIGCTLTEHELIFFKNTCQQADVLPSGDDLHKSIRKYIFFFYVSNELKPMRVQASANSICHQDLLVHCKKKKKIGRFSDFDHDQVSISF